MTLTKVASILLFVLSALQVKARASDTLVVIFDRQTFVQGDTIEIEVYSEPYRSNAPAQTLHLWIDNIETGKRWKYRYPFLKGRCKLALKVNDSIPDGTYAFNFLLQNQFLAIKGKVLNADKQDSSVNYVAKAKNKIPIIDGADLEHGGYFKVDNLIYIDSVLFSFSPTKKKKENKLHISIETPIDSSFVPETTEREFINIGKGNEAAATKMAGNSYSFDMRDKKLLKEVIVQTKAKKAIDEYSARYVSGLFGNEDAKVIDFLESDEALSYSDLVTYLTVKLPMLVLRSNPQNGQPVLMHRNEIVDIYVDEFLDKIYNVQIQDVAMVKFFPQSLRLGGGINDDGFGGSLAIYTKKPMERKRNKLSNYTFILKGYSPVRSEWK